MAEAAEVQHYKAYRPRPFVKAERPDVTILYGGLTWKHERLLQGVMENLSYNAQPLPNITRSDLDVGKEYVDAGSCSPTIMTTGNLASFLLKEKAVHGAEKVANKYVFTTFGACGPCRFGQYHESYSMALDGIGLKALRMLLLSQNEKTAKQNGDGLEMNVPFGLGVIWALLCADVLTDLEYLTRPFEVNPGDTDRVLKESIEDMFQAFRDRPDKGTKWGPLAFHLLSPYFTDRLREIHRKWDQIEVDRLQPRAKVKITGEFWLQTHEGDGNYNIKRWLEQEGGEVIPPPVAVWIDFLMSPSNREAENPAFKKSRWKQVALRGVIGLYHSIYNSLRKALGDQPNELPSQEAIKHFATPFFSHKMRGGEGHMLVGKALHTYHHKKAHMVCELSPYSCMPNTMSIGSMANVLGRYPDLLYAPIEIKGDAEVHALSRCQMILTEAKKRAQAEFDSVLAKTGLTVERIREYERRFPEVRRATYKVPHLGHAGTGSNYIQHLANSIS